MGKIYIIGAMKGDVEKSVSVFNLAYFLKKRGKKGAGGRFCSEEQSDYLLWRGRGGCGSRRSEDGCD